jgi:hypothetical protein
MAPSEGRLRPESTRLSRGREDLVAGGTDAVAAAALGLVERRVGGGEDLLVGEGRAGGRGGDAAAEGDADALDLRVGDRRAELVGEGDRLGQPGRIIRNSSPP